jgi:tRNA(fMet)-specific endonuclease VapC
MTPAYLLDTNIVSYFVRGNYPAVRKHIIRISTDLLAVSAVTEAELRVWVMSLPGSTRIRIGVQDFLSDVPSLPWDSGAAQSYAHARDSLRRDGRVLSTADLMIAAHALSLGLTLVTHDCAFSIVDGFRTEDWTVS